MGEHFICAQAEHVPLIDQSQPRTISGQQKNLWKEIIPVK